MWPFELVATPTASPRVSPAGTFRKFGTEVYAISGTFCAVAFCCAKAEIGESARSERKTTAKERFIGNLHWLGSCEVYQNAGEEAHTLIPELQGIRVCAPPSPNLTTAQFPT